MRCKAQQVGVEIGVGWVAKRREWNRAKQPIIDRRVAPKGHMKCSRIRQLEERAAIGLLDAQQIVPLGANGQTGSGVFEKGRDDEQHGAARSITINVASLFGRCARRAHNRRIHITTAAFADPPFTNIGQSAMRAGAIG